MHPDIAHIIKEIETIQKSIYGCGNGKVQIDMLLKRLKKHYGLDQDTSHVNFKTEL